MHAIVRLASFSSYKVKENCWTIEIHRKIYFKEILVNISYNVEMRFRHANFVVRNSPYKMF